MACKLTYVEAYSDRGKSGIHSVIIGNQNKMFKTPYSSIPLLEFLK